MSLHTIKDHEHDLERIKKREYPNLDGVTTKQKCSDDGCDYYITQWQDNKQQSLNAF